MWNSLLKPWQLTENEHDRLWSMLEDFWHDIAEERGVDCSIDNMPAGGAFDVAGFQLIKAYEVILDASINGSEDNENDD